jgi:class 3 adenylate cyclase
LLIPIIENHDGILLKVEGDSFLVIFRNVTKALACALTMRDILEDYNKNKPEEEKVLLCTGLGYGKVLRIGDTDVFGHEVNIASKLGEDRAKSGEILVTENVKNRYEKENVQFELLKEKVLDDVSVYLVIG